MKTLCLIFGLIFLVNCSTAQYSYVYEIRHDNKPKNEDLGSSSEFKYNNPSDSARSEAAPGSEQKTREFSVKAPEMGSLFNMLKSQIQEKSSSSESNYGKQSSPLVLQSNTDSPTYARQPLPKSYINVNELPVYDDKFRQISSSQKGYPILESRPSREEVKVRYEPRPYSNYPSQSSESRAPSRSPRPQPQEKNENLRTVHQIQTPNYRISLVSKPESLDNLLPLLEQYQLSNKPFQSLSQSPQIQSYPSEKSSSYKESSYKESEKPLMLSVEPDARIVEPQRYTTESQRYSTEPQRYTTESQRYTTEPQRYTTEPERYTTELQRYNPLPESRPSPRPHSRPIYEEKQQPRAQPMRQFSSELKSEPRAILDFPRQELPPQMQLLKGRPVVLQQPSEPRHNSHSILQSRPSYSDRPKIEQMPVTALYQMNAPDLKKSPQFSRVEYASEEREEPKRENRRPTLSYNEEPEVYKMVDRPERLEPMSITDLNQQLEKLQREDPSAQKLFFDKIKSQSMELSDRSRTKYRDDEQPLIPSDPNYKPSPIPDEYKPFTQTRYFKTYV